MDIYMPSVVKGLNPSCSTRKDYMPSVVKGLNPSRSTRKDKNMFILQKIPTKGMRAFDIFVTCLQETSLDNPVHEDLIVSLMREVNEH